MSEIKLIHYRDNCIGCNACCLAAPQNWKMNNEEGKADLIGGVKKGNCYVTELFSEDDYYDNMKAAESCPMNIIQVNKKD